jgi:uncharacterized protein GlcG (DUF336 family)
MPLTLPLCTLLIEAAEARATAMGVPMAITLADDRGEMLTFARMVGTLPASTEIAVAKAYTAAALRMPTEQVGLLAQPGEMLYGIQSSMKRQIVTFGGDRPLFLGERVIGAIGISGGSVIEDMAVVDSVMAAFQAMKTFRPAAATIVQPGIDWSTARVQRLRQAFHEQLPLLAEEEMMALTGAVLLV